MTFRLDRVDRFDLPRQELQTRGDGRHGHDYLVIATGCVPTPKRIEGLKGTGDHFYQYQPARRLTERPASLESGRVFITVSFPRMLNMPHQCGIASVGTTLVLDDHLRRRGVHERVETVYTYPTTAQLLRNRSFPQRSICEILPSLFEQCGIRFQRGFTLARVDPKRYITYSKGGDEQLFDLLTVTPPIHAVDTVGGYGLSQTIADEGWLPTNRETLQIYDVGRVYTLGDTVGLLVSKAGGACHNQVPVVISNIAAGIRLGKPCAIYDGRVQAVAQMGLSTGVPPWYDYRHDVKPAPSIKPDGLLRQGFNRGLYWVVARGML